MNFTETRLLTIPSMKDEYAIVSLPKTTWGWLDDFVRARFPAGGYKAMIREIDSGAAPLSSALSRKAQEYCEKQMAELYDLANDNIPAGGYGDLKKTPSMPANPDISANMPTMYLLFHFLPHATYLSTVWERRHYHLKG